MKNDINSVICEMRNGAVLQDINAKFDEMVSAILATGGKGELTIKLTVYPSMKSQEGLIIGVTARHEVKVKKPDFMIGDSTFYVDDGRLTRSDPAQKALFELPEKAKEARQ